MPDPSPATVLFVDDDINREPTSLILRQAGFEVLGATTGADALRQAARQPDLILLDVQLPDVSGFEVCRQLKADPATASIPVLHLSGVARTGLDKAHGLNTGADGYLTKPVEPEELLAHVRALLRMRRAEEAVRQSAERLRLLIHTAYDAFVAIDGEGVVIDWNRQAESTFGWTRDEALGKRLDELVIPARHQGKHSAGLAQLQLDGDTPVLNALLEVTGRHKDGREFPAEVVASLVRWQGSHLKVPVILRRFSG